MNFFIVKPLILINLCYNLIMSKVKILNKPTKSKTKNTLAIMHAKTANKPLNKKLKANESKTTKTATKASQNKTAKNMCKKSKKQ